MTNPVGRPKRTHSFEPRTLDRDEAGETAESPTWNARAQDEAFRAALLRAIGRGKERVREGVKTADPI